MKGGSFPSPSFTSIRPEKVDPRIGCYAPNCPRAPQYPNWTAAIDAREIADMTFRTNHQCLQSGSTRTLPFHFLATLLASSIALRCEFGAIVNCDRRWYQRCARAAYSACSQRSFTVSLGFSPHRWLEHFSTACLPGRIPYRHGLGDGDCLCPGALTEAAWRPFFRASLMARPFGS
jgi:hypothetical protein